MTANLEKSILGKLQSLSDVKQQEVLALVEEMLEKERTPKSEAVARPIWKVFEELSSQVPADEWSKLPSDGAEQHDHYLYGSPKRVNP